MTWRRVLVFLSMATACLVIVHAGIRLSRIGYPANLMWSDEGPLLPWRWSFADSVYPFRRQGAARARLEQAVQRQDTPPTATGELGLARYAEYALNSRSAGNREEILREGMRRDPDNALYHYLLADYLLKDALTGKRPYYNRETHKVTYSYRVRDRAALDRAMQEIAIGQAEPYRSRHDGILREQLTALPQVRGADDSLLRYTTMAELHLPEFAICRNLALVNSYYLSLLLAEGNTQGALRVSGVEERLAVQLVNDKPPTFIGMLVAVAISDIGRNHHAANFRAHGMEREAKEVERRHDMLAGEVRKWKDDRLNNKSKQQDVKDYYLKYSSTMGAMMLPVFGDQRTWITPDALRPLRLLDYVLAEEIIVVSFTVLLLTFMLFAGLKYLRWKLILRSEVKNVPLVTPNGAALMDALGWGFLLPLALYIVWISIPQISGRSYNISSLGTSSMLCVVMLTLFPPWILAVPAIIMSEYIRRRFRKAGLLPEQSARRRDYEAIIAVVGLFAWSALAVPLVLWVSLVVLMPIVVKPLFPIAGLSVPFRIVITVVAVVIAGGLVLLPATWERKRRQMAAFYLSHARAVVLVYAVLLLAVTALYPILRCFERHYVHQDRVLGMMDENGVIAMSYAEGKLVLKLREQFNEGAKRLQMSP